MNIIKHENKMNIIKQETSSESPLKKIRKHLYPKKDINKDLTPIRQEIEDEYKVIFENRTREAKYRKPVAFFCRYVSTRFKYTLYEIGKFINRDHSSVIHQLNLYKNYSNLYSDYREEAQGLFYKLDSALYNRISHSYKDLLLNAIHDLSESECTEIYHLIEIQNKDLSITIRNLSLKLTNIEQGIHDLIKKNE